MPENASRDENSVPTLLGASSVDGISPIKVYANPNTHRLLVDSTAGVVSGGTSTDMAVARWDGTTGETLQDSLVIIDNLGNVDATSYSAGGTAPVADGTYTVGLGTPVTGTDGTITIKGGIITAVQEAT